MVASWVDRMAALMVVWTVDSRAALMAALRVAHLAAQKVDSTAGWMAALSVALKAEQWVDSMAGWSVV